MYQGGGVLTENSAGQPYILYSPTSSFYQGLIPQGADPIQQLQSLQALSSYPQFAGVTNQQAIQETIASIMPQYQAELQAQANPPPPPPPPAAPAAPTSNVDPTTAGINQIASLPIYQMLFGPNAINNYQQSPGYQFQMQQGLRNLQQQGAAQGLLESGAMDKSLVNYGEGLANQDFSQYQNSLMNMYTTYQNALLGVASQGSNAASNQANSQMNAAVGLGTNLANIAQSTGQNISSLYANQGSNISGIYLNTAAAESSNIMQGASLNAQASANSQAGQASQQSNQIGAALAQGGSGNTGASSVGGLLR